MIGPVGLMLCAMAVGAGSVLAQEATSGRVQDTAEVATSRAVWDGFLARGQAEAPAAIEAEFALAVALVDASRFADAEKHWRRILDRVRRLNGPGSQEDIIVRSRLAETLTNLERDTEAEAVAGPAYVEAMRRFGAASEHTDRLRITLGTVTIKIARYDLAVKFLQPSLDYEIAQGDAVTARVVGTALANAYSKLDRHDDQRTVLTRLAGLDDGSAPDDEVEARRLLAQYRLAEAADDLIASERLARALVALRKDAAEPSDAAVAEAEWALALTLTLPADLSHDSPRLVEAEALFRDIQAREGRAGADAASRGLTTMSLGQVLIQSSRKGEARRLEGLAMSAEATDERERTLGADHALVIDNRVLLALQYADEGDLTKASAQIERVRTAIDRGAMVPPEQRGYIAMLDARLAFDSGDKALVYSRLAEAADRFRDQALSIGRSADTRRELANWAYLYQGQVMMAWRVAADLSSTSTPAATPGGN